MLVDGIECITTINLSNDKRTIELKQRTDSVGNDFTSKKKSKTIHAGTVPEKNLSTP
jgi:hypothetical protein